MRIRVKVCILGFAVACLAAGIGYGQEASAGSDTSLGDIARQAKAKKAKEAKPAKVLTNDTISTEDKPGFGAAPSKKPADDTASPESKPEKTHDADYFRSAQSKLQDQLDTHKRELSVLQQKLGQNQAQYYPNPQDSLMQQYTRDDINKRAAEIDAKKQQVSDDEKAMEDLHEQLRREGGDPSWLRE
jgi:hypothetical protein